MDLNKQFLLTNRASQAERPAAVVVVLAVGIQNKVDLNKQFLLTNIEPHRLSVLLLLLLFLLLVYKTKWT